MRQVGRRVAGVQWAESPIKDRVIAIGDAALAHDPVSGQGIRFALASAIAAASVIRTWRRAPDDLTTPIEFYADFVATERRRHRVFSDRSTRAPFDVDHESLALRAPLAKGGNSHPLMMKERLRFSGCVESAPLHVEGFIVRGEVIRMRDGGAVRWLGGFDLLRLRELTQDETTAAHLIHSLGREGLDGHRAVTIISWCMANGILSDCSMLTNGLPLRTQIHHPDFRIGGAEPQLVQCDVDRGLGSAAPDRHHPLIQGRARAFWVDSGPRWR